MQRCRQGHAAITPSIDARVNHARRDSRRTSQSGPSGCLSTGQEDHGMPRAILAISSIAAASISLALDSPESVHVHTFSTSSRLQRVLNRSSVVVLASSETPRARYRIDLVTVPDVARAPTGTTTTSVRQGVVIRDRLLHASAPESSVARTASLQQNVVGLAGDGSLLTRLIASASRRIRAGRVHVQPQPLEVSDATRVRSCVRSSRTRWSRTLWRASRRAFLVPPAVG